MFTRILVPLDGSPLAEQALPNAEEMAWIKGSPITLIQVIDLNRLDHYGLEAFVGADGLADQLEVAEHAARKYLGSIAEGLHELGITTMIATRWGDPAREIIEAIEPGDLVVMATHGRGGVTRALLGSVAESVMRRSPVPVLLVRATKTEAPSDLESIAHLLRHDRYRPDELAQVLNMDVARVRQAALTGQLPAQILDHHVISIARTDALSWLGTHEAGLASLRRPQVIAE
jgi:nucleotide-binding universal stress UspA family protein